MAWPAFLAFAVGQIAFVAYVRRQGPPDLVWSVAALIAALMTFAALGIAYRNLAAPFSPAPHVGYCGVRIGFCGVGRLVDEYDSPRIARVTRAPVPRCADESRQSGLLRVSRPSFAFFQGR